MKRVFIMIMDSFGIGSTTDAYKFGDEGADTFGHIAQACYLGKTQKRKGNLKLPNLSRLGLINASYESTGHYPKGMEVTKEIIGAYGYASELSTGKDTPSGHWEIAGVPVLFDWGYFTNTTNSFPSELLEKIIKRAGVAGYLGNCHSSGTVILDKLGQEHMESGKPIFYTSADSVFQIACHERTYGLNKLYELCEIAREELDIGQYNIGRVIARPFIGEKAGEFSRTGNRHDLSVKPPAPTVLQKLVEEKKGDVISVGKIADIFANTGITSKIKATGIEELFNTSLVEMKKAKDNTIVFTNFVDFDSSYGHRRDVSGYASALEYFDSRLPEMLALVEEGDLLIITADHGCDPTSEGTDHTREHIPILMYGSSVPVGSIGHRKTFADIGQSIATYLDLSPMEYGKSFIIKQ